MNWGWHSSDRSIAPDGNAILRSRRLAHSALPSKGTTPGVSRKEMTLATIACHSAVKLGDKLSCEEMEALIKDWLTSRYPATCPHGRSICYRIDYRDIACKLDRH